MKPGKFMINTGFGGVGMIGYDNGKTDELTIQVKYSGWEMWLTIDELKTVHELIALYLKGLDQ